MIKKRRQHIRKHLEDPDDENAHDDPFADFLGQGGFDDFAKAKAQGCNDKCDDDGRPNHEAFAELPFIRHIIPLCLPAPKARKPESLVLLRSIQVPARSKRVGIWHGVSFSAKHPLHQHLQ